MKQTFTKKMWRETGSAYFLLSPALFVLLLFIIGPIVFAVFLAFHKVQLLGTTSFEFVGLDNFVRIANDTRAKIALWNTLKYVAIVVPCQTILALVLAATLNAGLKGQKFFRIVYFLPTLTSSAVLTLIFMWMYNQNGFINHVLEAVGLPTYNWLGDPDVALNAIMIMNIWSTAPYFIDRKSVV